MNYEELVKDLVAGKKCEKMVLLGSRCKELLVFAKIQFKIMNEQLYCYVDFFNADTIVYDDDTFLMECEAFVNSLSKTGAELPELCAMYNCESEDLAAFMAKDFSNNSSKFVHNLLSSKPVIIDNNYWLFQVGKDAPFWAVDAYVSSTLREQMGKLCKFHNKALSESEADIVISLVDSLEAFSGKEEWLLRFLSSGDVDRDVASIRCNGSELVHFECCHIEERRDLMQEIPDDTELWAYIDGYSKYEEELGSVVATVSLTKHGDISVVWNLPEYHIIESVQNIIKDVIEDFRAQSDSLD